MASNPGYDPSGKARQLADGIYVLSQRMGGRVHAFLIDDNGSLTLIDTLFDTDGARVLAAINQIGRKVSDLKHVIATHAHRSHIGALDDAQEGERGDDLGARMGVRHHRRRTPRARRHDLAAGAAQGLSDPARPGARRRASTCPARSTGSSARATRSGRSR